MMVLNQLISLLCFITQPLVDDLLLSVWDDAQYAYVPNIDVFGYPNMFLALGVDIAVSCIMF
jgi:hypothetical protein